MDVLWFFIMPILWFVSSISVVIHAIAWLIKAISRKETKITKKLLKIFIKDIRLQDKVELELCYRDSLEEFYQICLDGRYETYFLIDDKNRPLALGGAFDLRNKEQKVAKLWLLATNQIVNHKLAVYRYIKSKILFT